MTIIYIIIAGAVVWWVLKTLSANAPEKRIEKLEEFAETMLSSYRTTNKVSYGQDNDDPEVLRMRDWYTRLKEKYKHDKSRLAQLAEDWKDYTYSLSSKNINNYLSLEAEDTESSSDHSDKARGSYLRIEEIENRFAEMLGSQFREELDAERRKKKLEAEAFWATPIEDK